MFWSRTYTRRQFLPMGLSYTMRGTRPTKSHTTVNGTLGTLFKAKRVDLSKNSLPDSGPFDSVPAEQVYENYESEHSYSMDQVQAKWRERKRQP